MNAAVPAPLTPPGCELRDFSFMPLEVGRLMRSKAWLHAKRQPELGFYMMNLWARSWHEVPAASVEDDDDVLADAAMCSPERWPQVRVAVLRGWVKCSDGRLYHPVVAEKANSAWAEKVSHRAREKGFIEAQRAKGKKSGEVRRALLKQKDNSEPKLNRNDIRLVSGSTELEPIKGRGKGEESKGTDLLDLALHQQLPADAGALNGSKPKALKSGLTGFDEFYAAFPRKIARGTAERAYATAVKAGAAPSALLVGAKRYAEARRLEDPRFTKYPATWLNGKCWLDESGPTPAPSGASEYPELAMKDWIAALEVFYGYREGAEAGSWVPAKWGPKPGEPGCRVPPEAFAKVKPPGAATMGAKG